jgi:hypothetical protein
MDLNKVNTENVLRVWQSENSARFERLGRTVLRCLLTTLYAAVMCVTVPLSHSISQISPRRIADDTSILAAGS